MLKGFFKLKKTKKTYFLACLIFLFIKIKKQIKN